MITQFFDTLTHQYIGPEREGHYITDGRAGALEPHIVEHEVIRTAPPTDLTPTQRLSGWHWTTDEQARTKTQVWDVETFTPEVPFCVPRRAFLLECNSRGVTRAQIRTLIDQLIADPTAREDALIELDTAETVERAHPLVALLGAQLQYTPAQLDAFFLSAAAR